MANDTLLTICGNLTADPELRFLPNGAAVADLTVASTPRHFDKSRNEWVDDSTLFMRCSAWKELGEHVAESLRKGMAVVAVGKLTQRSYETRDGQQRTVVEMRLDDIGPSLRRATAQVTRVQREQQGWGQPAQVPQQQGDPWGQPQAYQQQAPAQPAAQQQAGWGPEQGFPQQQHPTDPPF